MFIVAVEGPSSAGKSTLVKQLSVSYPGTTVSLPDYSSFALTDFPLPETPAKSPEEEVEALRILFEVDARRFQTATRHQDPSLIFMDRSPHTFLAHRFALGKIQGNDLFRAACNRVLEIRTGSWPHLILYLDTPQEILFQRYPNRDVPSVFCDPVYNKHFRAYFVPVPRFRGTMLYKLDGTKPIHGVLQQAQTIISELIH
jgi:thymidylate kinase